MEIHTNYEVNITTTERGNNPFGNNDNVTCSVYILSEGSLASSRKSRRKQIKKVFRKLRRRLRKRKNFYSDDGSATGPDPDYDTLTEPFQQQGPEWPSWEILLDTPRSQQLTALALPHRPSPAKLTSFRELGYPPPRRRIPILSAITRNMLCDGEGDLAVCDKHLGAHADGSRAGKPFAKSIWVSKMKRGVKRVFSRE